MVVSAAPTTEIRVQEPRNDKLENAALITVIARLAQQVVAISGKDQNGSQPPVAGDSNRP
jgi:hypothetical protein